MSGSLVKCGCPGCEEYAIAVYRFATCDASTAICMLHVAIFRWFAGEIVYTG